MKLNSYFIITFTLLKLLSAICFANRELIELLNSIKGVPKFEYIGDLIAFKDGQIDLSVLLEHTENLLRQSDYQNDDFLDMLDFHIYQNIRRLCNSSYSGQIDKIEECFDHNGEAIDSAILRLNEMQANRLLLYDDYYPVGELPEDIVGVAREKLQSNCLSVCKDHNIGQVLSHGSPSRYRQTVRKLTEIGPSCLKMALYSLGRQLQVYNQDIMRMKRIGLPENCEQEIGRQKNICEKLKRDHEQITQRISELTDLVTSQNSSTTTLSLRASCLQNNSSLTTIDKFFQDLQNEHDCSPYQPEEERELYPESFSGYKVKKEADGNYTVSMAMEFSYSYLRPTWESARDVYRNNTLPSSHIFDSSRYQNQIHNLYMQKVTECLNRANVKMLGPNGEQLNIVITDGKKDTCTPKHHIQIHRHLDRMNSRQYSENIDCPTMVHEILHNAGLVDEYKETWKGYLVNADTGAILDEFDNINRLEELPADTIALLKYNCRVTQNNSIMSNHTKRWNMTLPGPMGIGGPIGSSLSDLIEDSLIDPTHFNAILYGNCENREDVRTYRQCSELAYITSYQNSTSNDDCPLIKTECEQQDVFGNKRVKQQKRYRLLGLEIRGLNSTINRMARDLITLEQAAVQKGNVDNSRFNCSYPPTETVDISMCKNHLRDNIEYYKQMRNERMQEREGLRPHLE